VQRGSRFIEDHAHALQISKLAGLAVGASLAQQARADRRQSNSGRRSRGNARRIHESGE
jgi:hypothetical protein